MIRSLVPAAVLALPWIAPTGLAAEIVAWKIPLRQPAELPLDTAETARLSRPPEPSPFFGEGDALWDIKALFAPPGEAAGLPVEWIVWNAASGRIVAKGDMPALWKLHGKLRHAEGTGHTRLKLDLHAVAADRSPPVAAAMPAASLSWIARGGEFDVTEETPAALLGVTGAAISQQPGHASVKINATCRLGQRPAMTTGTALEIEEGRPLWFARDFDGASGMDLVLSVVSELDDGTPVGETTLIARDGAVAGARPLKTPAKRRLADGRWVHRIPFSLASFAKFIGEPTDPPAEDEPFADAAANWRHVSDILRRQPPLLAGIPAPPELRRDFPRDLLDIRPWLARHSPSAIEESSFIAYDPFDECIIVIPLDPGGDDLSEFGKYFSLPDTAPPSQIALQLTDAGESRIVGLSGLSAAISRSTPGGETTRLIEFMPTLDEGETALEIALDYRSGNSPADRSHFKSTLVLHPGAPLEILRATAGEAARPPITLRADILPAFADD